MTGWTHGIRERRRRLLAGRKVAVKILKRTLWQGFVVSRTFCVRVCARARSNGRARARPHVRGAFLTVPMHVSIRKCIYMPIPTSARRGLSAFVKRRGDCWRGGRSL